MHVSVLEKEVVDGLLPPFLEAKEAELLVDCTFGGGGHTRLFLERFQGSPHRVIAFDQDRDAIERGGVNFSEEIKLGRLTLVHGRFSEISKTVPPGTALGILADLGFSSFQVDDATRGLSFLRPGPLDMRLSQEHGLSCFQYLKQISEKDLADVIFEFGEERLSRRIARKIIDARSRGALVDSTLDLARLIIDAVPNSYRHGRIHPATRTFQALRIAVNDELGELDALLESGILCLKQKARIAIISFHSLEDRRVKQAFKDGTRGLKSLSKKPLIPSEEELALNPRSRSAKLRIAEKE